MILLDWEKLDKIDINYAEILYADDSDDTFLFGAHTHALNLLLQEVQSESAKYNTKLNLDIHGQICQSDNQQETIFCTFSRCFFGSQEILGHVRRSHFEGYG